MNPNAVMAPGGGGAASPRSNMLPPNIFDPRTDGSDYYWYVTNTAIAHGGVASSQIQIDSGTDFYWIATTLRADIAGAAVTNGTVPSPNVLVTINDTGTSRNLMNGAIPLPELAGDGREPYRLVRPRLFRANSVINFSYVSYEAAVDYANLYVVFHGYRRLVSPPSG